MRKKIIVRTLLALLGLVLLFVVIVALQPAAYRISRSATMQAPPAAPFAQVNDFHNWEGWSPWAKLDPAAQNTFTGPTAGTGAKFAWSGNEKVGEGNMTITESKADELVRLKLVFIKPFADSCDVEFTFQPQGEKTEVTWIMQGRKNFMGKLMCLFMNMDQMLGGDFEKGLASMKAIVERK